MFPFRCVDSSEVMKKCLQDCARDVDKFAVFRNRRLEEMETSILARDAAVAAEKLKAERS